MKFEMGIIYCTKYQNEAIGDCQSISIYKKIRMWVYSGSDWISGDLEELQWKYIEAKKNKLKV